jgi:hypothetical protein
LHKEFASGLTEERIIFLGTPINDQVANLIKAWTLELSELMGAAGINSIESLRGNRDRLRGYMLDEGTLNVKKACSVSTKSSKMSTGFPST